MSSTCTIGRQGDPSLMILMLPVVNAQPIVGQGGKVHHGLESLQVLDRDVAEVLPNGRRSVAVATEHAVAKELVVEADDIMTRCLEVGGHARPDVTLVTSNQNPHQILCTSLG